MDKLRWQEDTAPVWDDETPTRLAVILGKKYQAFLRKEAFLIEAERNDEVVQVRTTLRASDGSLSYPVEGVLMRTARQESEVEELALLMVDYLDVYWNEYLSAGRETFVTLDWSRHECDGEEFFLRGFVRNLNAEADADALFRQHGTGEHFIEGISSET